MEREEMVVRSRGLWRASEIVVKRHTRKPGGCTLAGAQSNGPVTHGPVRVAALSSNGDVLMKRLVGCLLYEDSGR